MLLDVTAWFVAVALVYTPGNEFDEFDDVEHNQHKSRKQSNRLRAEKENSTECQEDSDTKTSGGHREEN